MCDPDVECGGLSFFQIQEIGVVELVVIWVYAYVYFWNYRQLRIFIHIPSPLIIGL